MIARLTIRGAATMVLAALMLGSGASATRAATLPSAASRRALERNSGPTDREVASFVRLENAHRAALGLPALIWDRRAAAVAQAHSRDMFDRRYFSHTTPDGRTTWDRLAARDIAYSRAGENIAWGQRTGREVLNAWLGSRGHRENIERGSYTHHGVGKVGAYWTEIFLVPRRR